MGDLRFLRLWHNNAGKGDEGSWFCDFVSIIDLQTKAKYTFLVEKWFGVDEDDGLASLCYFVYPHKRLRSVLKSANDARLIDAG